MPDTAEPVPPDNEVPDELGHSVTATPLSDEQFDINATSYLEAVESQVGEALAKGSRIELEHGVSYTAFLSDLSFASLCASGVVGAFS